MSSRISQIRSRDNQPPIGTRLIIEEKGMDRFKISIPSSGFTFNHLFPLVFSLFWISIITLWTVAGISDSLFFALFSVPFWIAGVFMVKGLIESITVKQTLSINREILLFERKSAFGTTTWEIPYHELNSIDLAPMSAQMNPFKAYKLLASGVSQFKMMGNLPTISYLTKEITFAEQVSNAEQRYLVDFLNERIVPFIS